MTADRTSQVDPSSSKAQLDRLLVALEEKELEIEQARSQLKAFQRHAGQDGATQMALADLAARDKERATEVQALRQQLDGLTTVSKTLSDQVRQLALQLNDLGQRSSQAVDELQQAVHMAVPTVKDRATRRNRQLVMTLGVIILLMVVWFLEWI